MIRYLVRRLLQGVLTFFFGATFVVYALMFANQNDPLQALAGERPISDSVRQTLTERYHLNEPFIVQYGYYMRGIFQGDFGTSLTNRPISELLENAWPNTARLAVMAVIFAALIGIVAGVVAGIRRTGIFDHTTLIVTLVLISIPIVVLAPLMQLFFGVELRWFPRHRGSRPGLLRADAPGDGAGRGSLATYSRLTRTSVVENLRADYVRTAKAKGLTRNRVIGVHVLRNSLIPVITYIGVDLGGLMAGAIVTEGVFNIPGVGSQLFRGITTEDGPLVVGFVSILVIIFILANLIVDLLYAVLDPRIRYE